MKTLTNYLGKALVVAIALFVTSYVFTSCKEEEPPFLSIDQESVISSPEDSRFVIDVKSNVTWTASCSADWVKVFGELGEYKGSFEILLAANKSAGTRTAEVIVSGGGCTAFVNIIQTSDNLSLVVPVKEYSAGKDASEVPIKYIVSAEDALVEAFATADWLSVKSVADGTVKVGIAENTSGEEREASVKIVATDKNAKSVVCETFITQAATENILDVLVDSLNVAPLGEVVRIPVVTNSEVKVNCTSDWCTAGFQDGIVLVTAGENDTNEPRAAYISVSISSGKGLALSKTFKVKQWPVVIKSDELMILVPEFRVKAEGAETVIPFAANTTVTVRSNSPWCKAVLNGDDVVATIDENTDTDSDREAYVTIKTKAGVSGTVHILQNAAKKPEKKVDELKLLVAAADFTGKGGELRLPFTYKSESVSTRTSSDWLGAEIQGNDVYVTAIENWSGSTRKGYIAVQTADETAGVITITQTSLTPKFLFSSEKLDFSFAASETYVNITSTGAWKLNNTEAQIPGWIKIDPTSGDGDCVLTVSVSGNKFATARSIELSFSNTDHMLNSKIAVNQAANPQGISDYKYLGKGYDASGTYAEDVYVKASVLDCDAMAAADCISDLINMNQTVEETIRGKTLKAYEENYTAKVSVSGKWGKPNTLGFSGSVTSNFSSKALGSEEHSFATFRHVTKKQILKINENETAASLMDYRSQTFVNDIAKLDAESLVKKYGTHVIMGFSTGGVIDYSMAADVSKMSSSIDFGLAVKAAFSKNAVGSIETEDSFDMYNSIKEESNGFETKLLCRGGESQYTSAGFSTDAQAATAYKDWLTSLTNSSKWVMVDYEGSQLIPLYEFIEDGTKKSEVEEVVDATLTGTGIKQTSSYKTLECEFLGIRMLNASSDVTAVWLAFMDVTINTTKLSLINNDNSVDVYPHIGGNSSADQALWVNSQNGFNCKFYNYGKDSVTTGTYSLSRFKEQTIKISIPFYMGYDIAASHTDIFDDSKNPITYTLTCPADSDVWTYRDKSNRDHSFVASNGETDVYLPIGSGSLGGDIEMIFTITW